MRKLTLVSAMAAAATLAVWSAPGFAQSTASAAAPQAQSDSLDKIVCKTEPPPTGSRVGGVRRCKTEREWQQEDDARNRDRIMQNNTQNIMGGGGAMGAGGH